MVVNVFEWVKDQGSRIKDQGSNGHRKRFRLERKKSLQRLLSAKEAAGRRVSAGVLQENANEKRKAEQRYSHC